MPLNATGRNGLLTSGKGFFTHVGALTALTPTEATGGSYAAQAVTWAAASGGVAASSGAISIPIPAGTTVIATCLKDGLSGNIVSVDPYGSSGQVLKGVGTAATTDLITSNGHGLTTDDRVFVAAVAGESLPTGLGATTLYYVLASGLTTDAFKLSTTSGGTAVDITAVGELAWFKTVPNTFASAGNLTIASGSLTLDANFV